MDAEGAQATYQMETESLPSCPSAVSPVRLNNVIGSPRFGTVTPNRVFVGGIDFKTNENELKKFFAQYGSVTEVKIINDRAGVSKGYGFVTFETQEEAQKILQDAKKFIYKDKKLNIGPAIRKQMRSPNARSAVTPRGGTMCATTAVSPEAGTMYLTTSSGYPYIYHNGVAYFHTSEVSPVQQPWPSRSVSCSPVMVAPPVYQSPTYHYQAPTQCLSSQWQWSVPQSPTSSPPLLYLQPSEVFYQPIGINQEGGCISTPLLMEAPVPELYSDLGVQTLHHQPCVQSQIAMPAADEFFWQLIECSVDEHVEVTSYIHIYTNGLSCVAEIHHQHTSQQLPVVEFGELRSHSVRRNVLHHFCESETSVFMKSSVSS